MPRRPREPRIEELDTPLYCISLDFSVIRDMLVNYQILMKAMTICPYGYCPLATSNRVGRHCHICPRNFQYPSLSRPPVHGYESMAPRTVSPTLEETLRSEVGMFTVRMTIYLPQGETWFVSPNQQVGPVPGYLLPSLSTLPMSR